MYSKRFLIVVLLAWLNEGHSAENDWWTSMQLYQIYPRSFMDSDGDGIGDLRGIIQKLDHVKDTGAAAVWLSPIFPSPMYDFGYDTSDYTTIAPEYGTMEDFDDLIKAAAEIGLKVILDYVPNHTSHLHEWFIKSAQKEPGFEDYYIWHPGKVDPENSTNMLPPSNWRSVFRGSAWTLHEGRQEYYLHQFLKEQPDLNYRNPAVIEEMRDVLRFWLGKGVYGFRVDAIPHLLEVPLGTDGHYPDEPRNPYNDDEDSYDFLNHTYTRDLDELYYVIYDWRTVSDEFNETETKILMMEAMSSTEHVMRYYGNDTDEGAHFPFNFNLAYLNNPSVQNVKDAIDEWMNNVPEGRVSNWVLGNHDQPRTASRYGAGLSEGIKMVELLLPGVGITYQGEEIGMTDTTLTWEETQDPQACNAGIDLYLSVSRDPARTPFHWDDSPQAGFSTNSSTWLPIGDNYREVNLATQAITARSHYKIFKEISELRRENTFIQGDLTVKIVSENVLGYTRTLDGEPTYIVLMNMGRENAALNLKEHFDNLGDSFRVKIFSRNSARSIDQHIEIDNFSMTPLESLVLKSSAAGAAVSVILLVFVTFLQLF